MKPLKSLFCKHEYELISNRHTFYGGIPHWKTYKCVKCGKQLTEYNEIH